MLTFSLKAVPIKSPSIIAISSMHTSQAGCGTEPSCLWDPRLSPWFKKPSLSKDSHSFPRQTTSSDRSSWGIKDWLSHLSLATLKVSARCRAPRGEGYGLCCACPAGQLSPCILALPSLSFSPTAAEPPAC